MGRKGKRGLSPEEKALWERVAKSTKPLDHPARRVAAEILTPSRKPKPTPEPVVQQIPAFRVGQRAAQTPQPTSATGGLADRFSLAPVRMDHGAYKKLLRGKLKPEGRIDLHGMTLGQAHPVLTGFIIDAYDAGKRLVLVITGKGKDRDSGDPIPIRRGVLRHQVPNWLHAPPLGVLVLDVREAHQKHGGGGAYYVYLKRRR